MMGLVETGVTPQLGCASPECSSPQQQWLERMGCSQQASSVCGILLPEIIHRCHCACEQGGTRVGWDLYREFVQEFLGTGYSIQSSSMFHRPEMPLAKFHCYIIKWSDILAQCVCQHVYGQCFYETDG